MANTNNHTARVRGTKAVTLSLNNGHIEGMGEDADPIAVVSPSKEWGAIAVFDGMGGSGSTKRTLPNGEVHSEAYLASRFVKDSVIEYISTHNTPDMDNEDMAAFIKMKLTEYKSEIGIMPSLLKSSITRTLPTTMSMATWNTTNDGFRVHSYSAGDSRCYLLDEYGLKQITVDQIRGGGDAMVSLHDDPPMSNTISESKPFFIEKRDFVFNKPAILISCTDGCFGYLRSPMHFEKMLLDTMFMSDTFDEWLYNIKSFLLPVSGDDFSIAIAIVGHSFDFWRGFLQYRYSDVNKYVNAYDMDTATVEEKKEIWEAYKLDFERLAPTTKVEQD